VRPLYGRKDKAYIRKRIGNYLVILFLCSISLKLLYNFLRKLDSVNYNLN
jgi:hypothetical protein